MNKIFKFGLAVFAILLVSAACFADISAKDKRCNGAWASSGGADVGGFYFNNGKIGILAEDFSVYYDDDLLPYNELEANEKGFYFRGLGNCIINSVSDTEMEISMPHPVKEGSRTVTFKKMKTVPPRAKEAWYAPW